MSENYNDDEIIDSSEDTEKKRNKSEKFCFLCRRPESKAGPMIELPNNIHVCTDCMQKSFNSMNQQFNEGKFNYSDLLNMPNVSMIDLGSFQNPVQQPKKEKKKKKQEKPVLDLKNIPAPHKIKETLDQYVIGQEKAKKVMSVAVYKSIAALLRLKAAVRKPWYRGHRRCGFGNATEADLRCRRGVPVSAR